MNKRLKYCSFVLFVVISEKVVGDCFVSSHNASVMSSVMSYKDPLDNLLFMKLFCAKMKRSKSAKGVPTNPAEIECCYANMFFSCLKTWLPITCAKTKKSC